MNKIKIRIVCPICGYIEWIKYPVGAYPSGIKNDEPCIKCFIKDNMSKMYSESIEG